MAYAGTELIFLTISSTGNSSETRRAFPLCIENTIGASSSSSTKHDILSVNPLDNFNTVSMLSSSLLYDDILSLKSNLHKALKKNDPVSLRGILRCIAQKNALSP